MFRREIRIGASVVTGLSILPAGAAMAATITDSNMLAAAGLVTAFVAGAGITGLWFLRRAAHNHAVFGAELGALRQTVSRLRQAIAVRHDGYLAWPDGATVDSPVSGHSASFAERFGLASAPVRLDDLRPLFLPADFAALRAACGNLFSSGTEVRVDVATADAQCIFEVDGRIYEQSVILTFDDVTKQRQDERRRLERFAVVDAERLRYLDLLNAAPFPIWRRDPDLALAWCNAAYAAMAEMPAGMVLADNVELVATASSDQAARLAARVLETGTLQQEDRRLVVGGNRHQFRIQELLLANQSGLAGFGQDVTSEDEIRAELGRHIESHNAVLHSLSTAIGIFGPDKRLILFNEAYARLWDFEPVYLATQPHFSELLELGRENRTLPEAVDWQHYKQTQLAMFTSLIQQHEEMMHLPDGRTLRLLISPHPFGGLLFNYEDVTQQLVLERATNTLTAVQRASLDNLYEGVAVFGGDGRLRLFNKALIKLWDFPEAMLTRTPHIADLVAAARPLLDDGRNWDKFAEAVLNSFFAHGSDRGRIERPDGLVLDFTQTPLPDGAQLVTFMDVTDSTRIERALRERNEALQAADQLKSEFISNVSYELRTPLNTIIGFAEILTNQYFGALNDRQLEYSNGILGSSNQLLLLVNDILDLATIESGHMVLEPTSFDLHAALVSILNLVRERARRQSLTIEFDCPSEIGWIEADERRIKQVLFNLMSNAIKFTPAGGMVTLGARRKGPEFQLWVKDTGIGIPSAEQEMVFDKFQKAKGASRQPGAGLGLALVRSFVELHGGRVGLQSSADQGTLVTCHLPVRSVSRPPALSVVV